jgi:hypothetical protein
MVSVDRYILPGSPSSRVSSAGRAADLGDTYFRSSWERNYARYLNFLMHNLKVVDHWSFEPETFWFKGLKRGCVSYKPDFRVKFKTDLESEYHEIKGRVLQRDRTKWHRMKLYHPKVKLVIIGPTEYRGIAEKFASAIPNWEKRGTL